MVLACLKGQWPSNPLNCREVNRPRGTRRDPSARRGRKAVALENVEQYLDNQRLPSSLFRAQHERHFRLDPRLLNQQGQPANAIVRSLFRSPGTMRKTRLPHQAALF